MAGQGSTQRPTPRTSGTARHASSRRVVGAAQSQARQGAFSRLRERSAARATAKAAQGASAGTSRTSAKTGFSVPSPAARRAERQGGEQGARRRLRLPSLRTVAITLAALVLTALVATVAVVVLSRTSLFTIEAVVATSSEHVSEESLTRLARPEDGATLLNVDTDAITESVMRNPWVAEVHITRSFPSTLRISVTERRVEALVVMGSGEVAWCLGDGGVWIEPIEVTTVEGQDFVDAALAKAREIGAALIRDIPATVSPVAAEAATDEAILAVTSYIEQFSEEFASQVVCYSAPSAASVSCTLISGVTVSLGEPTNVAAKETVVTQLLEEHAGQITYINVRVPTNPSYRTIDSPSVQEGTGALGESGVDPEAAQQSQETAEAGVPEDGDSRIQTSTTSDDDSSDDWYDEEDEEWW